MTALIVIPCLNEERNLERVARTALEFPDALIVIADGGSTDRTPEIALRLAAAHPAIHYLPNPKRLQSAAVNLAVATYCMAAAYLIRLDAHADYPAGYCQILVEEAERTGAASVVVAMRTIGVSGFQLAAAAAQNSKLGTGGAAHRSTASDGRSVEHGHHALMRLDAFQAVNGYDDTFSHNEDAELDLRLLQAGYTIWLTGRTALDYHPRATPGALFRQYVNYGGGRARTILKHHALPKLRQLAPAAILPALLLALASPFTLLAAVPVLAWGMLCLGYGLLLGLKARDGWICLAGPAAMLMHLGWSLGFWRTMLGAGLGSGR
jgi:succinoglycan biosynthesis protein ExoA